MTVNGKAVACGRQCDRIALFGGSFDPPHLGHELLARRALRALSLDMVLVVPAFQPVHRDLSGQVPPEQKLAWLRAIWQGEPAIEVVAWEREGAVPTIATLRRFAACYPGIVPLLLLGADAADGMAAWVEYPAHRALCNLAVFPRNGRDPAVMDGWRTVSPEVWRQAPNESTGRVVLVEESLPEVSATEVRVLARTGGDLRGVVPEVIRSGVRRCYG